MSEPPYDPRTREASYSEYAGPSYGSPEELPLAPLLRRAGARAMDTILVAVFGFALVLPIAFGAMGLDAPGSKTSTEGGVWNWPIIITLFIVLSVLPFIYEAVQLAMWGQTLGKRVLHLRVVQVNPPGDPLPQVQAVWRAGVNNVGYQIGFFFFLVVTVFVWDYAAYGILLVSVGMVMAYVWAVWDRPLNQAMHDRFARTVVIDDRAAY
ncbi:RDD family protein [Actinomadura craniellae]|uniref:RDD family protein n=1 Tax=Actinomadura craniellae TaxID=2231787 RepID=A0A365H8C5_9ACTN|nr:RDD family protein [Actinomadura craniellae]RAY15337.1 RDD family protein [Actinomadura craniellae]